jgi:hypothetical protein
VTLGPAGVVVRPEPVTESLDNGIIGLTRIYETPGMADEITIDWRLFSKCVSAPVRKWIGLTCWQSLR